MPGAPSIHIDGANLGASSKQPVITIVPAKAAQGPSFFPPLRENIDLYPSSPLADGSPTWVLHDPVSNRFVEIGWQEFEILNRWHLADVGAIIRSVNQETALTIDFDDIKLVGLFLASQQFLKNDPQVTYDNHKKAIAKQRGNWLVYLISHYLFFRVPLVRPDTFLVNTLWLVRPLFTKTFRRIILSAGLFAFFLVMRQWDVFIRTTLQFISWDALFYYLAALIVAKSFHELGHAYCCKYYGLHVPVIGIAFMVFTPFLYTDTGETWKLTSRRQRLHVVIAGMAAEGTLAILCTLAWTILPPGVLRNTAFFLATTSWVMTLTINISPFMRWDGYYLLSDLTGIKNLQTRAIEVAKWRVRELIFGFGDAPPEDLPPSTERFMIAYAVGVWIYRLVIFLGIALLVYHFFIKVLAIILAAIEILWFIWFPIQKELMVWYSKRKEMYWNRHSIISFSLAMILLLLFFLPWRSYLLLPAVIRPAEFIEFYPVVPARIEKIHVREHEQVIKGAPLFDLVSPELEFRLQRAAAEIKLSEALLQRSANDVLREQREVAIEQNIKAMQQYQGLKRSREQLYISAPFDGIVVRLPKEIQTGLWVAESYNLGMLANNTSLVVYAYANADELETLQNGARGEFYPDNAYAKKQGVSVSQLSMVNAEFLADPMLASVNKGPIPVIVESPGHYKPRDSVFLVQLTPDQKDTDSLNRMQRGYVRVHSAPRSYALRVWRNFHSLLIRESGF